MTLTYLEQIGLIADETMVARVRQGMIATALASARVAGSGAKGRVAQVSVWHPRPRL